MCARRWQVRESDKGRMQRSARKRKKRVWKSRADVSLNNYRTLVLCPLWCTRPWRPIHKYLNRSKLSLLPSTAEALPHAECTVGSSFSLRLLSLLDTLLLSRPFFSILRSFSFSFLSLLYFPSNCKFDAFFVNILPPENDVFRMHTLKSFSIHLAFWEQFANAVPPLKLTDFQVKRVVRWDDEYTLFVVGGEKFQTLFSGRLKILVFKKVLLCGVGNPYKAKYQSITIIFYEICLKKRIR